jgi:hypothetical protein
MRTVTADLTRADRSALVAELESLGANLRGNECRCPFHSDNSPSANVYRDPDGVYRVKCHAASCGFLGDVFDVRAKATGKPLADVLREAGAVAKDATAAPKPAAPKDNLRVYATEAELAAAAAYNGGGTPFRLDETNAYRDPDTRRADLITFRLWDHEKGRKTFRQGHERAPGEFVMGKPAGLLPLFNRTRLRGVGFCVVVEGEKCVRALAEAGVVATTGAGGAGKAALTDWSPLADKTVCLWPDRDDPDPKTGKRGGIDHMREVAAILRPIAAEVYWIDPDGIGLAHHGADAADLCAADPAAARTRVEAVIAGATPLADSAARSRIEDCIAGKYATCPWPWPVLTRLSQALRPGTVTVVCGDPGAAKSLMLFESVIWWTGQGTKAVVYELEEDAAFWELRALAILDGKADLTVPEWIQAHPDEARRAFNRQRAALAKLSPRVVTSPEKPVTYAELLAWMELQAKGGARVIGVDPVTAVAVGQHSYLEDLEFMTRAKVLARKHGASVVLVTHPRRTGKTRSPLEDTAGGSAFPRFAQTVLWVRAHRPPLNCAVAVATGGARSVAVPRTVHVAKARNAAGGGCDIAFDFGADTLRHSELGLVVEE